MVHQTVKLLVDFPVQLPSVTHLLSHPLVWSAVSSSAKGETDSMFLVREALENRGIRKDSVDIIMSRWREGTKCYHSYIKKWINIVIRVKLPFVPLQTN